MVILSELRQICRRVFTWHQAGVFLILSVGLTFATVMYAIGYGYSSYSLPYKDAKRLVMIGYQSSSSRLPALSLNTQPFHEWRERDDLFTGMAALAGHDGWRLRTPNGNINLRGNQVTLNFFDILGVWFPELEEWKRSAETRNLPLVLLTHEVGVEKFGRRDIGQLFRTLEGDGVVIGGILPAKFVFPNELANGTTPESGLLAIRAENIGTPSFLRVIGRLAPGITPLIVEQALAAGQSEEDAKFFGKIVAIPLQDIMTESSRPIVWGSWALSGLVLILCYANLSGILLVRCSYRLREYSLRAALGAVFLDLVRLFLMELIAISTLAAGVAWIAGRAAVFVIGEMMPVKYLSFGHPVFGWNETIFLATGTIAAVILSALAALVVIGLNYRCRFSHGQLVVFHSQRWIRMLLTAGQVAIAMFLLSLSYIAVRGYLNIFTRDVEMDTSTRVVSVIHSPAFQNSMIARKYIVESTLDTLHGGDPTTPVAVFLGNLFSNFDFSKVTPNLSSPIQSALTQEEISRIRFAHVSQGFFRTAKIKILAGREFDGRDIGGEVLITASFARRIGWSPAEAVGQLFGPGRVVIGVVNDFPTTSRDEITTMTCYAPINRWFFTATVIGEPTFYYIVHPDAIARIGNIEQAIYVVDPDAIITRNVTWGDLLGESIRGQTFVAISVSLFTIAAIAIVVIGISNTVMFIIARRTKDIAIHIAMGAQARHVCWFVVSDMVKAGIIGIMIGGLASWWAGKAVAHLIYNGDRYQNMTGLVLTSVIMIFVIVLATLLPALRVLRIEPSLALKLE